MIIDIEYNIELGGYVLYMGSGAVVHTQFGAAPWTRDINAPNDHLQRYIDDDVAITETEALEIDCFINFINSLHPKLRKRANI